MRLGVLMCVTVMWLLPSSCVQLRRPSAEPAQAVAEELFDRGVAELSSRGETTFFETLYREYPASPWASRARAVMDLAEGRGAVMAAELERRGRRADRTEEEVAQLHSELEEITATVAQIRTERDRLAEERADAAGELDRLRADNAQLRADNAQWRADNARLVQDLEQLKNLTIEMELKR